MPASPHLKVQFQHRLGTLELDVNFASSAPWTILFGASGSGKSTVLRAIAGVVNPNSGRIVIDNTVVFDSRSGICLPPHKRRIRWAPQRAMLFPHLTIRQNLALGVAGAENSEGVEDLVRHFKLMDLVDRRPSELSGGERHRISVIRAAAAPGRAGLLLLDEPFTGLDASVRDRLIAELRTWRGSLPVVSVTHDVGEAFLLDAEVIRIGDGQILDQGPAGDVLAPDRAKLLRALGPGEPSHQ